MKNTLSTLRIIALAIILFASVTVDAKGDQVITGMNNLVNFEVKSSANVKAPGAIMNANLLWGKWQVKDNDVDSVNNKEFTDKEPALFSAMGRSGSPSGTEGNFDIFIDSKMAASVYFNVPFAGSNTFTMTRKSDGYMCEEFGFSTYGSPSITITCYKLA